MKKVLLVLVLAFPLCAQSPKGRIFLLFNDETFDLAINSISIHKENEILISAKAEKNDTTGQQMISIELPFKELEKEYLGVGIKETELRLQIYSRKIIDKSEKRFSFNYGPQNAIVEYYYKNERINWQYPSMEVKITATNIEYDGKALKITGKFRGKYNSNMPSEASKTIVEIKDGSFEIII